MRKLQFLVVLLGLCALSSCYHTSVAPLSDPQGQIVSIEIPGARHGKNPSERTVGKFIKTLSSRYENRAWPLKYFPEFDLSSNGALVSILAPYGDLETTSGRKFCGALPIVMLRSDQSAESTENALREIVADVYRDARKSGMRVVPVDQLKEQPKPDSSPS